MDHVFGDSRDEPFREREQGLAKMAAKDEEPGRMRFTSVIIPRAMLFAGVAVAVVLVSRNILEVNHARQEFAAAKQDYRRWVIERDRCVADLKKSGKYGDLVDLVIDGSCPAIPAGVPVPTETFIREMETSRANALEQAGIIAVLASLPLLASRWTRARVRSPIRAGYRAPNSPR
jgi:hypothetical protein